MGSVARKVVSFGVAVGAVVTCSGLAAGADQLIVPGVGIGGVRLGMDSTQVEARLGKNHIDNGHATVGGADYVEWAWNFASWTVDLRQTGSQYEVVQVAATVPGQRTSKGVGPGTPWLT